MAARGLAVDPQWLGSAQGHDSTTDRERSALRPIRRFRTCHSDDSKHAIEKVNGTAEKYFKRAAFCSLLRPWSQHCYGPEHGSRRAELLGRLGCLEGFVGAFLPLLS